MILFGVGQKHLLTEPLNDKCPKCDSDNSLSMEVSVDCFDIFWIPFFPLAKRVFVKCSNCDFNKNLYFLNQHFKDKYKQLKPSISTPRYLYTGAVLALLLIVFLIFRGIAKDKKTKEFVYSPMVGDIYEVKSSNDRYSLNRIVEIIGDSVFVCFHKYETDRKYDLKDFDREGGFDEDIYLYFKDELISLYLDGYVLSVERGPALIPYEQYESELQKSKPDRSKEKSTNPTDSIYKQPASSAAK